MPVYVACHNCLLLIDPNLPRFTCGSCGICVCSNCEHLFANTTSCVCLQCEEEEEEEEEEKNDEDGTVYYGSDDDEHASYLAMPMSLDF